MERVGQSSSGAGKSLLRAALGVVPKLARVVSPPSPEDLPSPVVSRLSLTGNLEVEDLESSPKDVEEKPAAGWALLRSALSQVTGPSPISGTQVGDATRLSWPKTPGTWDRERAFEIADDLEGGNARETATDFTTPLRRSSKLWRFRVVRSEDKLKSRLLTEAGEFLMYAETSLNSKCVSFFLYDPVDQHDRELYDSALPTFTMTFNEAKTEWRLVQERCDNCRMAPSHLSCTKRGKQQLAVIRHVQCEVGDGTSNCMDVFIPGLYDDGTTVIWCPMLGKSDLADVADECLDKISIISRLPEWNEKVESLVLDFKGRTVISSAKNFQLSLEVKPKHTICQYAKLSASDFGLDFKYPLSVIQSFGIAMSVIFWQ
eukprot:TRINITY_DN106422_c0_g1_i1.p1 TRINITY_DN106422_c0_g1~~TRINITY_DN106422_c0_g1_i1.p1  ORF type:complete len:373 (-),score=51.36 TRINITY_DN106422_c0_g1_i1:68-1186(-)